MSQDKNLPPLPEPRAWVMEWPGHSHSFTDDKSDYVSWFAGRASYPNELKDLFTYEQMHDYARAAIAAHLERTGQSVTNDAVRLSALELRALNALIEVAAAAHDATDDGEDRGDNEIIVPAASMETLGKALDDLDALPDDQPGYVMGPAAKSEWALRRLTAIPPEAATVEAAGKAPAIVPDDEAAEKAYVAHVDDLPRHAFNRVPSWAELSESKKQEWRDRAALAAQPRSTLDQQIADAQAEVAAWPQEKRESMRLQGTAGEASTNESRGMP